MMKKLIIVKMLQNKKNGTSSLDLNYLNIELSYFLIFIFLVLFFMRIFKNLYYDHYFDDFKIY